MIRGAFNALPNDPTGLLPTGNSVSTSGTSTDPFVSFFSHFYLWYIQTRDDTTQPSGAPLQWDAAILAIWTQLLAL
jgi:hypothetical protein